MARTRLDERRRRMQVPGANLAIESARSLQQGCSSGPCAGGKDRDSRSDEPLLEIWACPRVDGYVELIGQTINTSLTT